MTDRMKMETPDLTEKNIEKIAELFPNCITESKDEKGNLKKAINFDILKQMLSKEIVDGDEAYEFTWVGKKAAMLEANKPIRKTLRPCPEESLNWDTTQNLYIEGDNLEVLKLLQESYLGKVKMIYIDPPYNTGNDFIYKDDFAQSLDEYEAESGQFDEEGNKLFKNSETNGRFHSDWCSMMYSRLMVARNLLSDDGVIFISINDKEINSLKDICAEIFGGANFIATLIWDKNHSAQAGIFKVYHEYILVFCKNIANIKTPKSLNHDLFEAGAMKKVSGRHPASDFTFPAGTRFDAPDGTEITGEYGDTEKVIVIKGRLKAKNHKTVEEVTLRAGFTQTNQMKQYFYGDRKTLVDSQGQKIVEFYFNSTGKIKIVKERSIESPQTTCHFGTQGSASTELANLFELNECPFSSPKPISMIKDFILRFMNDGDIVLDFFSGSATTAHSVFQVNAESTLNKMKFILVQIAEDLDESLKHAQKDAVRTLEVGIEYLDSVNKPHTICEIGKERIRRAGRKILEEYSKSSKCEDALKPLLEEGNKRGGDRIRSLFSSLEQPSSQEDLIATQSATSRNDGNSTGGSNTLSLNKVSSGSVTPQSAKADSSPQVEPLDIGFRVFKLADSNMKDVYYSADEYSQQSLQDFVSNIKEDRTDLDLLFGCLLEWGLPLSMPYSSEKINGFNVHTYNDGDLIACFDENVSEEVIKIIAKRNPLRAVFRDSSFVNSPSKINVTEIFKLLSPNTRVKVI